MPRQRKQARKLNAANAALKRKNKVRAKAKAEHKRFKLVQGYTDKAILERFEGKKDRWRKEYALFTNLADGILSDRGVSRTIEENRLLLLALRAAFKWKIDSGFQELSWRNIENEVAEDFRVGMRYVRDLRLGLLEDGDLYVYGHSKRGLGAPDAKENQFTKLRRQHLLSIAKLTDDIHSEGETVTSRKVRAHLFEKFEGLQVHKSTVTRTMKKLGLSWSPIGRAKRTYASYRINEIKKYLIALDRNIRDMQTNSECNKIFVFTDESYVNVNHSCKNSYLPQDKNKDPKISKKSGKGRRLIILHAITEHGPLVDLHEGRPVDDLKWRGDTSHPEAREDGKQTCETL